MIYVVNSFSLNMVSQFYHEDRSCLVRVSQVDIDMVKLFLKGKVKNAIGHADTDLLVRKLLEDVGYDLPPGERMTITDATWLVVAQYSGPRLPEGTTSLPEGAALSWLIVRIDPPDRMFDMYVSAITKSSSRYF